MKLLTTAAGLVLTVSVAGLFTLAIKSPSSAFAQAIKQVRESRPMSYTELLKVKGEQQPVRTKVFISEDGRKRSQTALGESDGVTTISDASGHPRITLIEGTKTAIVQEAKQEQGKGPARGPDERAWLQALRKLGDKPDKELGQKDLEGKRVTGFVATQGNFTFKMWVDTATGNLVRIEYEPSVKGAGYEEVAMTDFRFDERLVESLFSFAVPAGYTVQQQSAIPSIPGGEASIIEALRGYTNLNGGKFPSSVTDWGPWAVLFSKDSRDGKPDAETTRVMAHLGAITPFLVSLPKDNYAYLGEGKTINEKDAIVFWYKRPDGTYRAIYGDLSAKDVAAENLPKN